MTSRTQYRKLLALLALLALGAACGPETEAAAPDDGAETDASAAAEGCPDFPSEPVTMIVPYAAGGGTDILARELAPLAEERLGVSVIVENQPGGSTVPALNEVLADPSGHTIILQGALIAGLQAQGIADLGPEDFASVINAQADSMAINVSAESQWETIEDFVAAVEESPGELQVSTSAAGGVNHAAATLLQQNGLNVDIVPFNEGSAPAITALLGDRVDAVAMTPAEIVQYLDSGDVRMLAVGADQRLEAFPEVPTFAEAGLGEDTVKAFRVILTNPEVEASCVEQLESALLDAANSEPFTEFLDEQRYEAFVLDSEETVEYLAEQTELFASIYDEG